MLKKVTQYIVYGAVALFTIQYLLVDRISPATMISDISECLKGFNECAQEKKSSFLDPLSVHDSVLSADTEKEREAVLNSFELDIIDLTNKERISRSLPPLIPQALLAQSARVKALDMYKKQYFEHDSPEGKGASDLAKASGYDFLIVGENLALGDFKTPASVVEAWMNSTGHRENILNTKYRDIGVSMISGTYNGKQALFIVQHFGTNRSICPTINSQLKNVIDITTQTLKEDEMAIGELKDIIESEKNIFSPEYAKNVTTFNTLIEKYNTLLQQSRNQISQYNQEVRAFNACLANYQ
jgi:uncharacterized protein YkwD